MKKIIALICLLILIVLLNADIYVGDQNGLVINPGDNVYIYGVGDVEGFSIDYPRELFMQGGSVQVFDNCILIGTLRSDITRGGIDTLLFNTQFGTTPLPFGIVLPFHSIDLEKQNLKSKERIEGAIKFGNDGKYSSLGIDSVMLQVEDALLKKTSDYMITYGDLESSTENGAIDFSLELLSEKSDYYINVIYYSCNVSDTVKYAAGFSTRGIETEYTYLLMLDSKDGAFTMELEDQYYNSGMYMHPLFFRGSGDSILQNEQFNVVCIVSSEAGYILKDISALSAIMETAEKKPVFIFTTESDEILDQAENREAREFFEMMMNISLSKDSVFDEANTLNMNSLDGTTASKIYDKQTSKYTLYKIKDNIYLFMFIPSELSIENINSIIANEQGKSISGKLYVYGGIQLVISDDAGYADLEFFSITGKFAHSINDFWMDKGENYVNLFHYMKQIPDMDEGYYFYKIQKDGICIKSGRVFFFR